MSLPQRFHLRIIHYFVVILLAVGFFGGRSSAQNVSVAPGSGIAGSTAVATVTGFLPDEPAPQYPHASVSTDGFANDCPGNQACNLTFALPPYPGTRWVVANGLDHGVGVTVSNSYTVLTPSMMLDTTCGPNFTRVIASGHHYARNDFITISIDGGGGDTTLADTNGDWSEDFYVYVSGNGPHQVVATGSGALKATNTFVLTDTADDACKQIGVVDGVTGNPTITPAGGGPPQPLHKGDPFHYGDTINTGPDDKVDMLFLDDTQVTIFKPASLKIDKYVYDPGNTQNNAAFYSVLDGGFKYISGLMAKEPDHNIKINTQFGNIGIRGTEFISRRDPCSTTQEVYLIHGQLAITPLYSGVTNIVDAPATIFYDATNVVMSGLTQAAYDALKNEINQTNPVSFASWQVQYFGCTNGNAAAAVNADPDGDGQNNYAEFLARTDPTTNASVFKLISAARESDGVRLVWQTHGGITNVVQAASTVNGSYADISSNLVIAGNADVTTNYLDSGVITNAAARFYRIRLAP